MLCVFFGVNHSQISNDTVNGSVARLVYTLGRFYRVLSRMKLLWSDQNEFKEIPATLGPKGENTA